MDKNVILLSSMLLTTVWIRMRPMMLYRKEVSEIELFKKLPDPRTVQFAKAL